ncbi:fatty acid elongation [Fusarium albosuccineum]|uniref:Elongation of fatty acids protein n=1 Tax=Fusarium albosuccineum TaxID=1237068 RepID=A0A8H4PAG0_9HYPO|nr:fatty acid elongation [Fusarium albosuccineum]
MAQHLQLLRSVPESNLFNFPPTNAPAPIPPVDVPASILRPFNIPGNIFVAALDAKVPLTIAILYAVTVKSLNVYNKSHGKKPWAISKTRPFQLFVVLHNIFLAVYSAWTFWGMLGGMRRSIQNPMGPQGLAGTADSFCRLHGSQGLGNSIYYNESSSSFVSVSDNAALVNGLPSGTEAGRIWNEGLAYYGWIFYLSKFYEVLDTFIILAKGKLSSTLQTYHHAGAMMCMWAGMRYMSAPIWMFVLVNSFIHALMYFYYTLTAFSIRVPTPIKRTLTSMQITQFLVGATYAMAHSFVSYTIPVTTTHAQTASADASVTSSEPGLETVADGAIESLKQFIWGAAEAAAAPGAEPVVSQAASLNTGFTSETQYITQPCITTTGETFAIWLNVLYLAPLTYLFVSFFIASYVKRSNAAGKIAHKGAAHDVNANVALAEKAGWDAAKGIEKEIYNGESMVNGSSDEGSTPKKSNGKSRRKA